MTFYSNADGKKFIKSGSIPKLIDKLVDPQFFDSTFMKSFLLTHREFMTSLDLLKALLTKLRELAPDSIEQLSTELSRVVNTLKFWVENHFQDFEKDPDMLEEINKLVEEYLGLGEGPLESTVHMLSGLFRRKLVKNDLDVISVSPALAPARRKSLLGKLKGRSRTVVKLKFLDLDPHEIADQLTLLDFTYFSSINCREFLEMVWKRPEKEKTSLDMTRMLQWSKHVSDWLISEIVTQKDNVNNRVQAIEKIVAIGTVRIFL